MVKRTRKLSRGMVGAGNYEDLHVAITNGNVEMVKKLLNPSFPFLSGLNLNKLDFDGRSLLHLAYSYTYKLPSSNKTRIFDMLLLQKELNPNIQDTKGNTVLHYACGTVYPDEQIPFIQLLLSHKDINVNLQNNEGKTPLHNVIHNSGDLRILNLLLPKSDVNIQDKEGNTVLHIIIPKIWNNMYKYDIKTIFNTLINVDGVNVNIQNKDGWTPLHFSISSSFYNQRNDTFIVDKLLAVPGINPNLQNKHGQTPLYSLVNSYPNLSKLQSLLNYPITEPNIPNDKGESPLQELVRSEINLSLGDNYPYIKMLLSNPKTNVNQTDESGESSLFKAAKANEPNLVEVLLESPTILYDSKTKEQIGSFSEEIQNLIQTRFEAQQINTFRTKSWLGFSKNDSEKLNSIHEQVTHVSSLGNVSNASFNENLYSMCPVCLKYIEHERGTCMYMHHDCKHSGNYYHKELYNKYKTPSLDGYGNPTGKYSIYWCTLCGRICGGLGGHQHYAKQSFNTANPTLLPPGVPYEVDCRQTSGGGGLPEKLARYTQLRKTAAELNTQVGQITVEEACNQLVEDMWDAPLVSENQEYTFPNIPTKEGENITEYRVQMTNSEFKIKDTTFYIKDNELYTNAERTQKANAPTQLFFQKYKQQLEAANINVAYPNAENNELYPIVYPDAPAGYVDPFNPPGFGDIDNIIQFRHRRSDGTINQHTDVTKDMVSKDMLFNKIQSYINDAVLDKIGPCWQEDCTALIYPQELLTVIEKSDYSKSSLSKEEDMKIYDRYRREFNKKYAATGGGHKKTRKRKIH